MTVVASRSDALGANHTISCRRVAPESASWTRPVNPKSPNPARPSTLWHPRSQATKSGHTIRVRDWSALLVSIFVGCGTDDVEPVNGPGVATCFPGSEVSSMDPVEPVVVRTGDDLSILRWNPQPELAALPVGRPIPLLLSVDATGKGVLAVSPSGTGHVEILHIVIEPTLSVSSLGKELDDPKWITAAPARDGQSFFVLRSPSGSFSTVVLERRRLGDASLIASATLPDSVAAARATALVVPSDGLTVLLTDAWAA